MSLRFGGGIVSGY